MRLNLVFGLFLGVIVASSTSPKALKKRVCTKRAASSLPVVTQCTATVLVSTITETSTASGVVLTSTVTETETTTPGVVISTLTAIETVTDVTTTPLTETATATLTSVVVETATETTTAVETLISHITAVETFTSHVTATSTVTSATTATETTVSISIQPTTITSVSIVPTTIVSTTTTTAAAAPLISNGNFEANNYNGWTVTSRVGGASLGTTTGGLGGLYCLSISTSYFANVVPASIRVSQPITCVAGERYRVMMDLFFSSSYSNGNPWSVVIGTTTIATGVGASMPWSIMTSTFTCSGNPTADVLSFSVASNNNRAGTMLVDNVHIFPLTTPN
ncbi:hypothetical protein V8F20_006839 [Naviculisporaceae sp. PSN 640]